MRTARGLVWVAVIILGGALCRHVVVRAQQDKPAGPRAGAAGTTTAPAAAPIEVPASLRVTKVLEKGPTWRVQADAGPFDVVADSTGHFYRFIKNSDGRSFDHPAARIAGDVTVRAITGSVVEATIEPFTTDEEDAPRERDLIQVPVRLPGSTYRSVFLELALLGIDVTDGMVSAPGAALQVHGPQQETDLLDRAAAELRALSGLVNGQARSAIGITFDDASGPIAIRTVVENSGAARAGIRAGDVILAIDGHPTETLGWARRKMVIAGPKGTTVTLRVRHQPGVDEDVVVARTEDVPPTKPPEQAEQLMPLKFLRGRHAGQSIREVLPSVSAADVQEALRAVAGSAWQWTGSDLTLLGAIVSFSDVLYDREELERKLMAPAAGQAAAPPPAAGGATVTVYATVAKVARTDSGGVLAAVMLPPRSGVAVGDRGHIERYGETTTVLGEAVVREIRPNLAIVEFVPGTSSSPEPDVMDSLAIDLAIPAATYDGAFLRAALGGVFFVDADQKKNLLDLETAYSLANAGDEQAALQRLVSDLRIQFERAKAAATPEQREAWQQEVTKGRAAGQHLADAMAATPDDMRSFLWMATTYRASYARGTTSFVVAYADWLLQGGKKSEAQIARDSRSLGDEQVLADIRAGDIPMPNTMVTWFAAADDAADAARIEEARHYARLLRLLGVATGEEPVATTAALIADARVAAAQNNDSAPAFQRALDAAGALPVECPESPDTLPGCRGYWRARVLLRWSNALRSKPDYAGAARKADEAWAEVDTKTRNRAFQMVRSAILSVLPAVHASAGDFDIAERHYHQLVAEARQRPDAAGSRDEVQALARLADMAGKRGDYTGAVRYQERALSGAVRFGFADLALDFAWKLGSHYWNAGQYTSARQMYEAALGEYEKNGDAENSAALLQNIGSVTADMGRTDEGLALLNRALAIAEARAMKARAARGDAAAAQLLARQRRYDEAKARFSTALARLDTAVDADTAAEIYGSLATTLEEAKQVEAAESAHAKAAELYGKLDDVTGKNRERSALARLYVTSARASLAEPILAEVLRTQREKGDLAGSGRTLLGLAELRMQSLDDPDGALKAGEEALSIAERAGNHELYVDAISLLGSLDSRFGDGARARSRYEAAIEAARKRQDDFNVARFEYLLGTAAAEIGDTELASASFKTALDYFRKHPTGWLPWVLMSQAGLEAGEGRTIDAWSLLEQARKAAGDPPGDDVRAGLLGTAVGFHTGEGKYADAFGELQQIQEIYRRNSLTFGGLTAQMRIAYLQQRQHELTLARKTWEAIEQQSSHYPEIRCEVLGNIAGILGDMGDYEAAERSGRQSIALADTLGPVHTFRSQARAAVADFLLARARGTEDPQAASRLVDQATALVNEAEALVRGRQARYELLMLALVQARRQLLLEDRKELVPNVRPNALAGDKAPVDLAVEIAEAVHAEMQPAYYYRGALSARRGLTGKAIEDLEASVAVLEKEAAAYAALNGSADSEAGIYDTDAEKAFFELLDVYLRRGDEAAQDGDEQAKGQYFEKAQNTLDRLRRYQVLLARPGAARATDSSDMQASALDYQRLIGQEQEIERRLQEEVRKASPEREPVIRLLEEKLEHARNQVSKQIELINSQYPDLAKRLEFKPDDLRAYARSLKPDEAIFEPILMRGRLLVFVARRGASGEPSVQSFTSMLDEKQFASELRELWKSASTPSSIFAPAAAGEPATAASVAANLYDQLFARAEPALGGVKTILISGLGTMRYVPFHVLLRKDADGGRSFMDEHFNIVYLTKPGNISTYSDAEVLTNPVILEFANPDGSLPEAETEADAIQANWTAGGARATFEVRKQKDANVVALGNSLLRLKTRYAGRPAILHIATHAAAGATLADSFLVLADGPLTGAKMGMYNFGNLSLVVLSACSTALGSFDEKGPGVTGFAGQFEDGGVKTVLGTLWKLDSQAGTTFMADFYKRVASGVRVADALRESRAAARGNPATAHPFYWAPFVLVGQWR